MKTASLPKRSSIDKRYLWNAESLFADRAAWRREAELIEAEIERIARRRGSIAAGGAAGLAAFLTGMLELSDRVGRLYTYSLMSQAVDSGDVEAQSLSGRAGGISGQFRAATAFLEPELIELGRPTIEGWIGQEPGLEVYRHFVDDLFRRQEHIRSAEVEEVLGLSSEVFESAENTHAMLVDADMTFAPAVNGAEVAQSSITSLLGDQDREVRRSAWQSYCDAHIAHENTLAAAVVTAFKSDVFVARVRRFEDSLEAALFNTAIPRSVFDSTIEQFRKNLPVWHRYWKIRRRALGVERLQHWDIWAPIARERPTVPYARAVDWISEALAPLGDEYVATLRKGCLEERWVDVYPTAGKASGAFSAGWKGSFPFVKMSYADDLQSMSTLAHELGHSMHSWHTWRAQPSIYGDYGIFVAEVASNFNQAMTRAHLFSTQEDSQFQIALIEEAMSNLHRYFFIMPTLAQFEREIHRRVERHQGVTAEDLNRLMADLFAEGYGGEVEIDDHREGCTWAQFNHLYMNYYVFQYATGISAAHALAAPILAGDTGAARRYLEFLSAGSSVYPVEALLRAGVDMRTPAAMESCFEVLSGLVDRLDRLTA